MNEAEVKKVEDDIEKELAYPKIMFLSQVFFYGCCFLFILTFANYFYFLYGVIFKSEMVLSVNYLNYLNHSIGLMLVFFAISKILKKIILISTIRKLMKMEVGKIEGSEFIANLRLRHAKIYLIGYGCLIIFSILLSYILVNYGGESVAIVNEIFNYPSFIIAIASLVISVFSLSLYYYLDNRLDNALFWAQVKAYQKRYEKEKAEKLST